MKLWEWRNRGAVYEFSERAYTTKTAPMRYAPELAVRPVRTSGEILWKGKRIYISQALSGERIGLLQLEEEHRWEIHYGLQKLGVLDDYSCKVKV
jgi:hypothetical protein